MTAGPLAAVQIERNEFTERLKQAMQKSGIPASPTRLARAFNAVTKGEKITVHAARKWLVGESIPTQLKIQELARMFGYEAQWLRFGGDDAVFKEPDVSAEERGLLNKLRKLTEAERNAVAQLVDVMAVRHAKKGPRTELQHSSECVCSLCKLG